MYKICHMTSVHESDDVRIFCKECVSLAKRQNYEVYLVAPGEDREEDGVKVVGIGNVPSSRIARMTKTAKNAYKAALKLDCDVYHFHDPELLKYGAKLARMGKHVIFDSHENTYEQIKIKPYIPSFLRKAVAEVYLKKETKYVKCVDAVIFPCPMEGKHPFAGRAKRTPYINNVPMLEELYDKCEDVREFDGPTVVCHVGSLTHERGITDLIEACYVAGVRLILGGPYSSKEYQDELEQKESYACVDYRGYCNREQVLAIYREATVGASTLLKVGQYTSLENLPTKVYEYMATGLPTILTNFPYGEKANDEYNFALLVDPTNHNQIADCIKFLAEDKNAATTLAQNGRKAIKESFNWGIEEQKLYELYEEILSE